MFCIFQQSLAFEREEKENQNSWNAYSNWNTSSRDGLLNK